MVTLAGCDKSLPGSVMAMARTNIPSIFLYGGTILPGSYEGKDVTIVDVFEAVGAYAAGTIPLEAVTALEECACPGEGSCGGLFTANTMASVFEAMGVCLPGGASDSGRRRAARATRVPQRGAGRRLGAAKPRAARHHHTRVHRERHHDGDGDGRIDERRTAPAGRGG